MLYLSLPFKLLVLADNQIDYGVKGNKIQLKG